MMTSKIPHSAHLTRAIAQNFTMNIDVKAGFHILINVGGRLQHINLHDDREYNRSKERRGSLTATPVRAALIKSIVGQSENDIGYEIAHGIARTSKLLFPCQRTKALGQCLLVTQYHVSPKDIDSS
jgi:hypothetical protein